jgi:hypothetical protein
MSHLNSRFHLNGKPIPNCYVFTLFQMVCHLEGGQGEHFDLCMAKVLQCTDFPVLLMHGTTDQLMQSANPAMDFPPTVPIASITNLRGPLTLRNKQRLYSSKNSFNLPHYPPQPLILLLRLLSTMLLSSSIIS